MSPPDRDFVSPPWPRCNVVLEYEKKSRPLARVDAGERKLALVQGSVQRHISFPYRTHAGGNLLWATPNLHPVTVTAIVVMLKGVGVLAAMGGQGDTVDGTISDLTAGGGGCFLPRNTCDAILWGLFCLSFASSFNTQPLVPGLIVGYVGASHIKDDKMDEHAKMLMSGGKSKNGKGAEIVISDMTDLLKIIEFFAGEKIDGKSAPFDFPSVSFDRTNELLFAGFFSLLSLIRLHSPRPLPPPRGDFSFFLVLAWFSLGMPKLSPTD